MSRCRFYRLAGSRAARGRGQRSVQPLFGGTRTLPLRAIVVPRPCVCVGFRRAGGQRRVGEGVAFGPELDGAIQAEFHHECVLGPQAHRLLREQLEPLIATAEGPVRAEGPREAHTQDAGQVMRPQQGAMRIRRVGRLPGEAGIVRREIVRPQERIGGRECRDAP